ncbi:MAG: peptide deformylase [Chromatiales bacterium]
MATLDILHYPDPRLRIKAQPVPAIDDSVRRLVSDLFETMYAAPGIGLAATQVNVHRRIIVMDVSDQHDQPWCFINPRVTGTEGREQTEEGCLSVPGVFETVERAERIQVQALNAQGETINLAADGLLAVCIQHEIDHLEGKLFVDYLSILKRNRLRKKLEKAQRLAL